MDKKQKMWLGAGVVAVGAYLLWKSKKASTVVVAAPATASLVGFDSGTFYEPKTMKYADANTKMEKDFYTVRGGHAGVKDQGDQFASATGGMKASFANQPFNFAGDGIVGDKKIAFAAEQGDRTKSIQGEDRFFKPRTAKYGTNQGVFVPPTKKAPVEPNRPMPVTQPKPLNNLVGANGLINKPEVQEAWGK